MVKTCKFYTASNMHFSMHNNLEEAEGFAFSEPLPFESCCNKEIAKASGTNQVACGYTADNRECEKYEAERETVINASTRDTSKLKYLIMTETRSRFGFTLREIKEVVENQSSISMKTLHTVHSGLFEEQEEFEGFVKDIMDFECSARSMNPREYPVHSNQRTVLEGFLNSEEKDESFMRKVFADATA